MTSDYVSWVLGLQGWQRAWKEDAYFAGEEDTLGSSTEPDTPEKEPLRNYTVTVGCQTPSQWADSGPAQKAGDAVPQLAPTRLVLLRTGTMRPNPLEHPSASTADVVRSWRVLVMYLRTNSLCTRALLSGQFVL